MGRIIQLLGRSEINADFWEDLQAGLIQADVGLPTTRRLLEGLQRVVEEQRLLQGEQVRSALADHLIAAFPQGTLPVAQERPSVTMLVGVNGSGKTTSVAKLAYWLKQQGKTVLLAAADTYRAAAPEQLEIWGERMNVRIIKGSPGADPAAVVYDACQSAQSKSMDHLVIDTSGRMHTERNLMDELQKIGRVSAKLIAGAPHATLLVLDATTGQNGLAQAKAFTEAVELDGIILAKLDGSAKGGVALAIQDTLALPLFFVGVGERLEDLRIFEPHAYVEGLLTG